MDLMEYITFKMRSNENTTTGRMESQVVSYIHPSSVSSVHTNTLGSTFVPFVTVSVKGLTENSL
jgi:hypothetical protein